MQIDLPILETIKDCQMKHGLKYENYQRYMSYCSRRLHRLRKSLNVHQGVAPTAKARHQRGRKLMEISNAMILEAGEKNHEYGERMLLISLFLVERAWSHSMLLKQEASEEPRKKFHMVRRLKKASQYAEKFVNLCFDPESPCTERTKEEVTAYGAYVRGLYSMECRDWAAAKDLFNEALRIYFKVSIPILNDEIQQSYRQKIEELRANLKYCLFNLGEKDNSSKTKIKVHLPSNMQFIDIAGRHAKLLIEQEEQAKEALPNQHDKIPDVNDGQQDENKQEELEQDDEEEDEEFEESREAFDEEGKKGGFIQRMLGSFL